MSNVNADKELSGISFLTAEMGDERVYPSSTGQIKIKGDGIVQTTGNAKSGTISISLAPRGTLELIRKYQSSEGNSVILVDDSTTGHSAYFIQFQVHAPSTPSPLYMQSSPDQGATYENTMHFGQSVQVIGSGSPPKVVSGGSNEFYLSSDLQTLGEGGAGAHGSLWILNGSKFYQASLFSQTVEETGDGIGYGNGAGINSRKTNLNAFQFAFINDYITGIFYLYGIV